MKFSTESDSGQAPVSITAMVLFTVLAASVGMILPMFVGAMVEGLNLTVRQAGLIAAADMMGASASSLVTAGVIARGRWKRLLAAGITLLVIADVLSGFARTFASLFAFRLLGGLGEGVLLAVSNASIGETRSPDRVFGLSSAAQVAFGAPALYVIPVVFGVIGTRGIFWSLAVLAVFAALLVKRMPNGARQALPPTRRSLDSLYTIPSILGLSGVFTYFVAVGAVWSYLERVGASKHIAQAEIGSALAISSFVGLAGSLLASWLDIRQGRWRPLLFGTVCSLISLVMLTRCSTSVVFATSAALFNFAWNFSSPFQFGALTEVDPSRRTVALGGVAVFGGLSAGSALAATVIGKGRFQNIAWLGMGFCVLSLLIFAMLLLPARRRHRGLICEEPR